MEQKEYTVYPCSGKKYNGEKAVISLTSWKARINTVSKTIYSLIKQCPGFHIVLVLSEEEFPEKEKELPEDLMMFVNNELIELLWVYKNYKSFKKWIFTYIKYKNIPIISADDGCIYIRNFAKELYDEWTKNQNCVISEASTNRYNVQVLMGGVGILYPPNTFDKNIINYLTNPIINSLHDDGFWGCVIKSNRIPIKILHKDMSFKNVPTYLDFSDAPNTKLWNNKKCSDENIKLYKRIFAL